MSVRLTSNKARIRDLQEVREILDSYEWDNLDLTFQEEGAVWTLEIHYHDYDLDAWERQVALRDEDLPSKVEYPDEDDHFDGESDLLKEKGDEGFLALLCELAAHLESLLVILVAVTSLIADNVSATQAWLVEPGAKEVETLHA
jgi:hypothetical protein